MGWELPIKSCFRKPKGNLELSLCCDCSHPTFPKAAGAPLPALTWLSSRSMLVSSRFRMNLWGNSAFFSSLMCSENLCSGLQKKITLVRRGKKRAQNMPWWLSCEILVLFGGNESSCAFSWNYGEPGRVGRKRFFLIPSFRDSDSSREGSLLLMR